MTILSTIHWHILFSGFQELQNSIPWGPPLHLVCKIHLHAKENTFKLFNIDIHFQQKFTNVWYTACFVPNLDPIHGPKIVTSNFYVSEKQYSSNCIKNYEQKLDDDSMKQFTNTYRFCEEQH